MARRFRQLGRRLIALGAIGLLVLAGLVTMIAKSRDHSPTAARTTTPVRTASGPGDTAHLSAVGDGYRPSSVSFVSATDGWLLGTTRPCPSSACLSLRHTTDGGHTWRAVSPPISRGNASAPRDDPRRVLFADGRNGFAVGQHSVWSTHDGAATWQPVVLPLAPTPGTALAVATAGGFVRVAAISADPEEAAVVDSSPVDVDKWTAARIPVRLGAGPVPEMTMTLHGATGWIVVNNRVTVDGARLTNGRWSPWTPPCTKLNGPVTGMTAPTPADLIATCDAGRWGGGSVGAHLVVSTDGGNTTTDLALLAPQVTGATFVATGGASDLVAADHATVLHSGDGGRHWAVSYVGGEHVTVTDIAFAGPTHVFTIETDIRDSSSSRLLVSHDSGRTWAAVTP